MITGKPVPGELSLKHSQALLGRRCYWQKVKVTGKNLGLRFN